MPDGGWLIVIIVGVVLLGVFGYLILKGHIDGKKVAKTIAEHSGKIADYLSKKRKHQKEADAARDKLPEPKPFSPDGVDDLLDRTNKPWPPPDDSA